MASESDIIDTSILAKAANQCMELKGTNAVFAIGKTSDKEVRVSARSDGTINVQIIMERLGGGGHINTAGAQFEHTDMVKAIETLKKTIDIMIEEGDI